MYAQIEQVGDQFFARLRTKSTVYLWSVFFTELDARSWCDALMDEAKAIQAKYDYQDANRQS